MLLGLSLLYVGAVLTLNGLWLLGHIGDREIVVVNVASGIVTFCVSLYLAFGPGADPGSIRAAGLTLLFTVTYFWVAHNRLATVDGRGLGWFSLFVVITVIPVAINSFATATTGIDLWMGWNWVGWAIVWFLYFLLLTLKKPILKLTGAATLAAGLLTGWLPSVLIFDGRL